MSKRKKTLFASFIGELGWHICWWGPILRYKAREYDRVVLAADATREHLTADFCDQFIPLSTDGGIAFAEGNLLAGCLLKVPTGKNVDIVEPKKLWGDFGYVEVGNITRPPGKNTPMAPRIWKQFGKPFEDGFDVLYNFRGPKMVKGSWLPDKEYPLDLADELIHQLVADGLSVACIGGPDNHWVEGSINFSGIGMDELCNHMASAKVTIGPSSGPLHLAQQCLCPVVTWFPTNPEASKYRYQKYWNPFDVHNTFLDNGRGYQPSPDEVSDAVYAYI